MPYKEKSSSRYGGDRRGNDQRDFDCMHCHGHVSVNPRLSGVQNRNHCPYCLWSRHVDLFAAGDRLESCRASMKPIGLTLKSTLKKYNSATAGELMLIHQCTGCGKVSINRIAADDDAQTILAVYQASQTLDPTLQAQLEANGIRLLGATDREIVSIRLFGKR